MPERAAFLATMISLATAAFGVVAALAWNAFITELVKSMLPDQRIVGLFVYAVVITVIAVLVIIWLGKLAARYAEKPAI